MVYRITQLRAERQQGGAVGGLGCRGGVTSASAPVISTISSSGNLGNSNSSSNSNRAVAGHQARMRRLVVSASNSAEGSLTMIDVSSAIFLSVGFLFPCSHPRMIFYLYLPVLIAGTSLVNSFQAHNKSTTSLNSRNMTKAVADRHKSNQYLNKPKPNKSNANESDNISLRRRFFKTKSKTIIGQDAFSNIEHTGEDDKQSTSTNIRKLNNNCENESKRSMFRSTSLDNRDEVTLQTKGNNSRRLPNQSWRLPGRGLSLDNEATEATSTLPTFNNNSKNKSEHSSSKYEIHVEVHEKEIQGKKL